MWPDVIELRDFYASPLGQVARRMIRRKLREIWPSIKGQSIAAIGYPTPYLRHYRQETNHVVALMPAAQGALCWFQDTPNVVALTEETCLPLPNKSVDFVLVMHALEFTSHPQEMIQEAWRILKDGGRLVLVVPNRAGLWSRVEKTPFGQGHPYSPSQLVKFLKDNTFAPLRVEQALYIPPFPSKILLTTATAWEKVGHRWLRNLSGVLMVEAAKQVYAGEPVSKLAWVKKLQFPKKLAMPFKE